MQGAAAVIHGHNIFLPAFLVYDLFAGIPNSYRQLFRLYGHILFLPVCKRKQRQHLYAAFAGIKKQVVKAKYLFVLFLEVTALVIMTICTLVRMTLLSTAPVYTENALMPANFFYLGFCLVSFGLFNAVFVRGYFKTAYKIGVPFLIYCLLEAVVISASEALGHFPGLEFFRATDFSSLNAQIMGLTVGAVFFVLATLFSYNRAKSSFERLDF